MKSTRIQIREIHYDLVCPYCKHSEYFGTDVENEEGQYNCSKCKKDFILKKR